MSDSSRENSFGGTHTDTDEDYVPSSNNYHVSDTLLSHSESNEEIAGASNVAEPGPSHTVPQTGRKRLERKLLWKRNIRKSLRTKGKSYINTAGSVVAEKKLERKCNCRKKCFNKIGEGCEAIFNEFYKLPTKSLQDSYLYGLMKRKLVKRRRPRAGTSQPRTSSYIYSVKFLYTGVQIRTSIS